MSAGTYADALAWCEEERVNMVAAVHTAADAGLTEAAWQLPAVLTRYFYLRSRWTDWLDTHRVAFSAAQAAGNRAAQAKILNGLGVTCIDLGRLTDAVDYLRRALELFRRCADPQGEAICLNNLGDGHRRLGEPDTAIDLLHQALTLDEAGQGYTLGTLGDLYRDTERCPEALDHYRRALAAHQAVGDRRAAGRILASLGNTLVAMGEDASARAHLTQARETFEELGDPEGDAVRAILSAPDTRR